MCQLITLVDILWERVLQLSFGKERIHWAVYHPEESSHKNNLPTVPYALSLEVMLRNTTVRAELGWPQTDEEKVALAGTYNNEMVTQAKSSGLTWSGGCSSYSNTIFFPSPLLMCDPSSHRKCQTDGSSAPHLADNCFMSPLRHFLSSLWATFFCCFCCLLTVSMEPLCFMCMYMDSAGQGTCLQHNAGDDWCLMGQRNDNKSKCQVKINKQQGFVCVRTHTGVIFWCVSAAAHSKTNERGSW